MITINQRFDQIVHCRGDRAAINFESTQYTYSQLKNKTDSLILKFKENGIKRKQLVALYLNDPVLSVLSVVALYRMGCGYMPLDPGYPEQRIQYMSAKANITQVVCDTNFIIDDIHQIKLDRDTLDLETSQAITSVKSGDIGYVIYTSGSTGKPKGVEMTCNALDNLINWQLSQPEFDKPVSTAQFSAFSFDVSFQEIFTTLCSGGCLFLIDSCIKKDFRSLLKFIIDNKIQRIFMPYIALLNLVQWANRLKLWPEHLVSVITAGEALIIDKGMKQFFEQTGAALYNQYGPTESHVVTQYQMGKDIQSWEPAPPIGTAIANTEIYLLGSEGIVTEYDLKGEICITGQCLAKGYINNTRETDNKFIEIEIGNSIKRAYRTGDIGKWRPDAELIYCGRVDDQVKIHGSRIELAEVESRLLDCSEIEAAAVTIEESNEGDKSLICFIVTRHEETDVAEIRNELKKYLPEYMIPQTIVPVVDLDKTPSGKIDRKKMREDYLQHRKNITLSKTANNEVFSINAVLSILAEELKVSSITTEHNLIDLGMNSLTANRIVARFYDYLSLDVPAYQLFQFKTVGKLLDALEKSNLKTTINVSSQQKKSSERGHDIAIIGMSVNVPGAEALEIFWDNLVQGKESLTGDSSTSDDKISMRGMLNNPVGFDAGFFSITPTEAEFIDPQQRVMLMLSWHALEDAGYIPEEFSGRIGIYCGTGNNTYYLNNVLKNTTKLDEYGELQAMVANEKDYTATRISHKLNLKGPSLNIQTACSTSLVSVCEAVKALRMGDCDLAIAGGSAISFPQYAPYTYQEGGIFSKDGHTRTFDANSSGTVFSDGAGMVILKRLDYAISDNDQIYAVIGGAAVNNDGSDKGSFSAPSIEGQQNVIYAAHIDASITADQVDYVEAHGTATPLGDPIEVEALTRAFSLTTDTDKKQYCGLGSVKSNIGHLTAGAGIIGMIKSALALKNGFIPPTVNFKQANPSLNIDNSPFYITANGVNLDKQTTNIVGVSSFGIGGTNAHVVLKSYDRVLPAKSAERGITPICISARGQNDLKLYLENYQNWLSTSPEVSLNQVAYSTQQFRKKFDYRISIAADSIQTAIAEISQKQKRILNGSIFNSRNVVFLFPGQGTQTIQMGQYLYVDCEIFRQYFDACAEILLADHEINITEIIKSGNESLEQTENAQVALFTISYALAKTLLEINVKPTHMLGHSIGELTCAVIAGVFSLADALEVVVTRGRLMQAQPPGDMIAVMSGAENLASYVSDQVVLAADNSPDVCTLSGPRQAMKSTMDKLNEAGIAYQLLNTSHAFHSPLMQGAYDDFIKSLSHIQCQNPQLPFISCLTGDWITTAQATSISYWARQIISTVNFRAGVNQLLKLEDVLIIEAGPRKTLTGLCLQNLTEKTDYRIVNLLPDPGSISNELADFRSALGQIWEANINIDWTPLYHDSDCYKVDLPLYPFQLKPYFIEPEKAALQAQISEPALASIGVVREMPAQVLPQNSPTNVEPEMNNSILERLKALFADASGLDFSDIDDSANFFELGLDSLFLTQASISIQKEFQVSVTFRQLLNECNSFSKLEKHLNDAGVSVQDDPQLGPSNLQPTTVDEQNTTPEAPVPSTLNNLLMQQIELIKNQTQLLSIYMNQGNEQAANLSGQLSPQPDLSDTPAKGLEKNEQKKLKPFGASVRINAKRSNELTPEQVKDLNKIIERYTNRLQKSKTFSQENRARLADPRVVSGFREKLKELIFPIVVERSKGAYLWDIDGNRYIDITCGFGSNFFGNGAEFIKKEVANQLESGYEIGPQNPIVAEVSKMFCEMTQSDRVTFCNTGSEAVLGAIRLARTVRAKDKIVMFENDYHGINDEVIVTRGRNGLPFPAAAGIPAEHVSNTIILDYGDERSLDYIRENTDQIAAVLVEPVQSRNPGLQPREFLKDLRIICSDNDVTLIFDEVITGLRLHPNGAQGYFDVKADIATYGKVIGGGMPIGMIAGKREYLDALDGGHWCFGDDSAPEVGVTYFAGTFVRHPLALAAAKAVLLHLKEYPDIQSEMNDKTGRMVSELNQYCKQVGAPVEVPHCGSLFKIMIPQDIAYEELIYVLLREKGIHIWDARPCFITTAHTDEDIRDFVNAFKQSLDEMLAMGFLPSNINTESENPVIFDADNPPVEGARLGKKPDGEPAWFIEDPEKPSKYRLLTTQ